MATFLVYDIVWDAEVDGKPVDVSHLPSYSVVWLPGYIACGAPEDDAEAAVDKLSSDVGFCLLDYKIFTIEAEDAGPNRLRPPPKTVAEATVRVWLNPGTDPYEWQQALIAMLTQEYAGEPDVELATRSTAIDSIESVQDVFVHDVLRNM